MFTTIQPSTTRNLLALVGDGSQALNYGKDVADLLAGDDTLRVDEGDLSAAAIAMALVIAARRAERSVSGDTAGALEVASETITEALISLRGNRPTGDEVTYLRETILSALVFQLTDLDEQD